MVEYNLLGNTYILKILQAPRFRKKFTLATPPPWYRNVSRLSKGQIAQIIRFSEAAHETRGRPLKERTAIIAARTSGPTGLGRGKVYTPLPRIGRIITIAQSYGIPVPPSLMRAPAPALAAPAVPRIKE